MWLDVGPVSVALVEEHDGVCRHERQGGFEPRTRQVWAELCRAGGVVLDVGAYTGLYALAAAKLGCSVFAFEPMPNNAQRLLLNAERNGARLVLHEAAVSDTDGTATLRHNPRVALTSGASLVGQHDAAVKVLTLRLDSLGILARVTAIKIDVERAEAKVVAGGRALIEKWRPAIVAEVLEPDLGEELRTLLPGYRVVEVMDDTNWLFAPC